MIRYEKPEFFGLFYYDSHNLTVGEEFDQLERTNKQKKVLYTCGVVKI